MHLCVRYIWYSCTLHRVVYRTSDVPVVIHCRWVALSGNTWDVNDVLCQYFTIHGQRIVGWKHLQRQYCTSLSGQDEIVSLPHGQDWYFRHCAWGSFKCSWICLLIVMLLSHCWYVAIQQYEWWDCLQNPIPELTLIYGSQDASIDIWNVLHAVQWFSEAPECQMPSNKLQTQSSRWTIPLWTTPCHLKGYRISHSC